MLHLSGSSGAHAHGGADSSLLLWHSHDWIATVTAACRRERPGPRSQACLRQTSSGTSGRLTTPGQARSCTASAWGCVAST